MANRPDITKALTHAAVMHWVKLRYGVFTELAIASGGMLRADVLCMNYRRHIVCVEVKSSVADYKSDSKWVKYLGLVDQFYFLMPQDVWSKIEKPGHGAGVMILDEKTGHLRCVQKAKVQDMLTDEERDMLVTRMAFRSATYTKRNVKRRTRVFLT